ncbi:hypothetical protein [Neobacillus thermocopriae]|nr:hypothetical protein [Neobacillus thermocopriae]
MKITTLGFGDKNIKKLLRRIVYDDILISVVARQQTFKNKR